MIKINDIVKDLISVFENDLGMNDKLFIKRVFSQGIDTYIDRLEAIGFTKKSKILDAGCGYGQWSIALATLNDYVYSCDLSLSRINFLKSLHNKLGIKNLSTFQSQLNPLPFPSSTFDAVFCYGVIFLTKWEDTLKEFHRVLKPDGKIYVNANGLGWYVFLWNSEHNKTEDYDPKRVASNALIETLSYQRDNILPPGCRTVIEPDELKEVLSKTGFSNVQSGDEGTLHLDTTKKKPKVFFKRNYQDLVGIHEAVASKI